MKGLRTRVRWWHLLIWCGIFLGIAQLFGGIHPENITTVLGMCLGFYLGRIEYD